MSICIFSNVLGKTKINPYKKDPKDHNLPPWLGEEVRDSDVVPKTEILKGYKKKGSQEKKPSKDVNEDQIMELVEQTKVLS